MVGVKKFTNSKKKLFRNVHFIYKMGNNIQWFKLRFQSPYLSPTQYILLLVMFSIVISLYVMNLSMCEWL